MINITTDTINILFCIIALRLKQSEDKLITTSFWLCFDMYTWARLGSETTAVCCQHMKSSFWKCLRLKAKVVTAESDVCDTLYHDSIWAPTTAQVTVWTLSNTLALFLPRLYYKIHRCGNILLQHYQTSDSITNCLNVFTLQNAH